MHGLSFCHDHQDAFWRRLKESPGGFFGLSFILLTKHYLSKWQLRCTPFRWINHSSWQHQTEIFGIHCLEISGVVKQTLFTLRSLQNFLLRVHACRIALEAAAIKPIYWCQESWHDLEAGLKIVNFLWFFLLHSTTEQKNKSRVDSIRCLCLLPFLKHMTNGR